MIPPVVAVASWKWLLDANSGVLNQVLVQTGLIDNGIPFLAQTSTVWWSVVAILVWRELPFVVIVLMAGLQGIPKEQYEAASLDAVNRWQSFRYITIPNLRPVLTVIVLMTVIQTFNNFVYVWLATGGGPGTYTQVLATQLYSAAFVIEQPRRRRGHRPAHVGGDGGLRPRSTSGSTRARRRRHDGTDVQPPRAGSRPPAIVHRSASRRRPKDLLVLVPTLVIMLLIIFPGAVDGPVLGPAREPADRTPVVGRPLRAGSPARRTPGSSRTRTSAATCSTASWSRA